MEPSTCHPKNATTQPNASAESASDLLVTSFLSCTLATMCMVGLVGNIYTLVAITISTRCTGSVYIITLALADLLYLPTVSFMVCTYFVWDWYFGDLGCRVLFSLDLLTMHTSIFILTIMSTEYYLAIVRPLDTLCRSRDHQRVVICLMWLVAFLFTLPTKILIDPRTSHCNRVTKHRCCPTRKMGNYKVYLTVIFNTCIIICCLYTKLARTYWKVLFSAPRRPANVPGRRSSP